MKILLNTDKPEYPAGETVVVRLTAFNDKGEAVAIDRRFLVGPNPVPEHLTGIPFPVSLEPAFSKVEQNRILLNPDCFYGRQRSFDNLPAGKVTIYAYLLKRLTTSLLPQKPAEAETLLASAEPLVITIKQR